MELYILSDFEFTWRDAINELEYRKIKKYTGYFT
jgi:hypothetical protein